MAGTNQITFTDKVNTRTLPIPSQNKVRDVDLNEIKQEHNALDNIVTDPVTGLVKVVEDIETALETSTINGQSLLAGDPITIQEGLTESEVIGVIEDEVPIGNSTQFGVDIEEKTIIKALAVPKSGTVIDFKFAQNSFGTFEEPLSTFTFNLLLASPFNVSYALVTSASVPTPITNLNTNGTEGATIFLSGDTFSTNIANINLLTFTYISDDYVNCENQVIVDGAPTNIDEDLLVFLNYTENTDFAINPVLLNESVYASDFVASVSNNQSDATSEDLGSGNRALLTGNSSTGTARSSHTIPVTTEAETIFNAGTGFTIVRRFSRNDTNGFAIISNMDDTDVSGIHFKLNSSNTLLSRINNKQVSVSSAIVNGFFYAVGITFDGTNLKVFRKSTANSVSFSKILDSTVLSGETIDLGGIDNILRFERPFATDTNPRFVKNDVLKIWRVAKSEAEVEAEINLID
jgi:hypothetical protein